MSDKFLYIDPEYNSLAAEGDFDEKHRDIVRTRASWLKTNEDQEVDSSNGLEILKCINPDEYSKVVIHLGDKGTEFDIREKVKKFEYPQKIKSKEIILTSGSEN